MGWTARHGSLLSGPLHVGFSPVVQTRLRFVGPEEARRQQGASKKREVVRKSPSLPKGWATSKSINKNLQSED